MCSETEMTTSLKSTDLYHLSGMMLLIILTASSDQGCDSNILYEPYINRSSTKAFNWSWIKYKILCIIISQCNCFLYIKTWKYCGLHSGPTVSTNLMFYSKNSQSCSFVTTSCNSVANQNLHTVKEWCIYHEYNSIHYKVTL